MSALFPGSERKQIQVSRARINLVHGGRYLPEEQAGEVICELERFIG